MLGLAWTASACATPVVTFKATAVPIAGFAHTGNIYGAGAAVEAEFTIKGTEYGGFPPPLEHVNVYVAAGVKLHPGGFPTCPVATLEPYGPGPKGCPKGSAAGPVGIAKGYVAFGATIVSETATIETFYAAGGGLTTFAYGHEPALVEILSKARFTAASGLYGKKLEAEVPLIETVPGAQDASVELIKVKVGSARHTAHGPRYYIQLPTSCPHGYLPVKSELTFAGLGGLTQQLVTVEYHAPCPHRQG